MSVARHMDMDMGDMGSKPACKMNMYWNWYTIDACFLSESWQITSKGMFAGSCIGVILLVMAMEFIRRAQREYDRMIVRQWQEKSQVNLSANSSPSDTQTAQSSGSSSMAIEDESANIKGISMKNRNQSRSVADAVTRLNLRGPTSSAPVFRPTIVQQLIRALFYTVLFGGAYILMLLVMYYNGYIYFCMLIGAFLGYFLFGTDSLSGGLDSAHVGSCA